MNASVTNSSLPARRITVLAAPTAQALELAGPIEVFAMAERKMKEAGRSRSPAYLIDIVSATEDLTIRNSSGLSMLAQRCYREVKEPIDTLLVADQETMAPTEVEGRMLGFREQLRGNTAAASLLERNEVHERVGCLRGGLERDKGVVAKLLTMGRSMKAQYARSSRRASRASTSRWCGGRRMFVLWGLDRLSSDAAVFASAACWLNHSVTNSSTKAVAEAISVQPLFFTNLAK